MVLQPVCGLCAHGGDRACIRSRFGTVVSKEAELAIESITVLG